MSSPADLRLMTQHMAEKARESFSPEAYAEHGAPGYSDDVRSYLRAAGWEHTHLAALLNDATRAAGEWPDMEPGSLHDLSFKFGLAIKKADRALASGDIERTAQGFTAVALLWAELRRRQREVESMGADVQRAATATGEEAAEKELQALAAAGGRPYRDDWMDAARKRHTLGVNAVRRVWTRVVGAHPELASTRGKAKRLKP